MTVGKEVIFASEKTGELIQRLLVAVKERNLSVNAIDVSEELSIQMKVEGRFLVDLGTSNDLENKIGHLTAMIDSIDPEKTGKINLSMWTSAKTEGTFVPCEIE